MELAKLVVYSGISQWYTASATRAGALRAEPLATLCLARSKYKPLSQHTGTTRAQTGADWHTHTKEF